MEAFALANPIVLAMHYNTLIVFEMERYTLGSYVICSPEVFFSLIVTTCILFCVPTIL